MVEKINKEFLEKLLNKKIISYSISTGSKPGDGLLSTLYSVDVQLAVEKGESCDQDEEETKWRYLLIKCYPGEASRQKLLNWTNCYTKELEIYKTWVVELKKFYGDFGLERQIQGLPFAPFYGGESTVFDENVHVVNGQMAVFEPMDNYIVMGDLRKMFDFKLADRLVPFDFDKCKLVMEAQATLHATSWAYKKTFGLNLLSDKWPQLKYHFYTEYGNQFLCEDLLHRGSQLCLAILNEKLGTGSNLVRAVQIYLEKAPQIIKDYFMGHLVEDSLTKKNSFLVKPTLANPNDVPWNVLTHGDPWTNNMLFRYDKITGKPCQVVPVDFQLCHESCPTGDLAFFVYYTTDAEFRQKYLDTLLSLYCDKFVEICDNFKVPPLPGFILKEVKRRFHMAKAFAVAVSFWGLPLALYKPDPESGSGEDVADLVYGQYEKKFENFELCRRLVQVMQEFLDQEVI